MEFLTVSLFPNLVWYFVVSSSFSHFRPLFFLIHNFLFFSVSSFPHVDSSFLHFIDLCCLNPHPLTSSCYPASFNLHFSINCPYFYVPFTPSPLPLLADLSPISPSASCLFFPHICPNLIRQQEDNRDCFIHHTHTHTFLTHTYLLYLHTHKAHTHSPRAVR